MSDELTKLRAELDAARAEIAELRRAVVTMCDVYGSNRAEKLLVKAYRLLAAKGEGSFSIAAVEAERARYEQNERGVVAFAQELLSLLRPSDPAILKRARGLGLDVR